MKEAEVKTVVEEQAVMIKAGENQTSLVLPSEDGAGGKEGSSSACQNIYIDEELKSFLVTVGDILSASETTSWIIEDIIPMGAVILLAGPPAHFKTWMALDIARCVSSGKKFLGKEVHARPVFYIDKENHICVQKTYLKKLGVSEDGLFYTWPYWHNGEPPQIKNGKLDLYFKLAKIQSPLMIFDSLIRFLPGGINENSANDMSEVMAFFRELTKHGATPFILHHVGKGLDSLYRGSSDILGAVDVALAIQKKEKIDNAKTTFTLTCFKNRFSPEANISIEVITDEKTLRFQDVSMKMSEQKEKEDMKNSEVISKIIETSANPLSQTDLINKVKETLHLGEHKIRALLEKGEGEWWTTIPGGKTGSSKIYKTVTGSSSVPQGVYSGEKLKSLEGDEGVKVEAGKGLLDQIKSSISNN